MHFSGDTCQQGQHFPSTNCPYVFPNSRCYGNLEGKWFFEHFSVAIPDMVTPFKNEVTEQTYLRVFQEISSLLWEPEF